MPFNVTYKLFDNTSGGGIITGPRGATVEQCRKVIHAVAPNYGILPLTASIEEIPKRTSKGFLHELYALLPDGRQARLNNWYY